MASYNFNPGDGSGIFRIGPKPSIFTDGAEFQIRKAVCGVWTDGDGKVINKDGGNSIRFETTLSAELDDLLNINKLLGRTTVVYNDHGTASLLHICEFDKELRKFLEEKIGRSDTDSRALKGSAKEIGDKVVAEFFAGKTIVCRQETNVFFKTVKDGVEKLEAPISPVITFHWK